VRPYYQDDAVTIFHGDCLEVLGDLSTVDLIVTDPQYGMGRFRTDTPDYLKVVAPALQMAFSILPENGSMFCFCSTREVIKVVNATALPFYRMLWMYKPNDCTFPLKGWLLKSEAILWFAKGNGGLEERRPYRHDCYVHTSVGQEGVEGHPTVKPIAVVMDLVKRAAISRTVLDPFMGSGTTLRAAKDLGRKAIGIEIEERYCEIAAKRMAQEVFDFAPADEAK
jgi:site-specific DNA-methyltransferase (adenine-specific)